MNGFFEGYSQETVSIRGAAAKSPMFFRDLSLMGAVFTADFARARAALPGGLKPLKLPLGRTLAAVHCLEYKDSDVGPYNEVSLSIGLRRGWLPLGSMLQVARSLRSEVYHAFVKSLPVTTEVALHGGVDYFNYPKYLADISFRETAAHRVCTVRDIETRDVILEFTGDKLPARAKPARAQDLMTLYTYPEIGGRPHRAKLLINRLERGARFLRGADLRVGPHPRAEAFKALGLGRVVQYLHAPRAQGVLFAPEALG